MFIIDYRKNIIIKMNRQKKDCFNIFNHALKDLIDDIIIVFPDYTEFKAIRIAYKIFKKINRTYPQEQFNETVAIHCKTYIINKDDHAMKIFIKNYNESLESNDIATAIIKKAQILILNVWEKLNNEQKDTIWKHLENLLKINEVCLKYKS